MEEKQYRPKSVKHFTLIVAGDNPEEMVKEYDINKRKTLMSFTDWRTLKNCVTPI